MTEPILIKPLGRSAYGSIPHLPGSRLGPGAPHISPGQARICCEKVRDKLDRIFVQEKLDGSCTAVTRLDGEIIALGRSGYLARSSPYEMHQMFAAWVDANRTRVLSILKEGQTLVGEWLAQAHGTRYELTGDPWVPFDLMDRPAYTRWPLAEFSLLVASVGFTVPHVVSERPTTPEKAMELLKVSSHGAIDPVEGAVWRVERKGRVDFLAKFVRHDKVDGLYLPELSGKPAVWNW